MEIPMDILDKIKALRDKASNAASTPAEVEEAARAAAKLMMKHDVHEQDLIDAGGAGSSGVNVNAGSGNGRDIDIVAYGVVGAIQSLTETKGYFETHQKNKNVRFVGLPHDVEMAVYLYEMITMSARRAWNRFADELMKRDDINGVLIYRKDFYTGFADAVRKSLNDLASERKEAKGTELVVRKKDIIADTLREHGVRLVKRKAHSGRRVYDPKAANRGRDYGSQLNLNRPFDSNKTSGSIK